MILSKVLILYGQEKMIITSPATELEVGISHVSMH